MQHHVITAVITFATAALAGVIATVAVRAGALRFQLLDTATSSRKIHSNPIPRLGGIAIATAFFVAVFIALVVDQGVSTAVSDKSGPVLWLVVAAAGLLGVGVVDDVRGVRARTKLAAQIMAASALYLAGFHIDVISFIPGHSLHLGAFAPYVTVFWVVAVMNALNLIDGMDGLAAGIALIAIIGGMLLSILHEDWTTCIMLAALGGATVGFLVLNFHPASIFMGDTGSMFLGAVLAIGAVRSARTVDGIAVAIPLILLGLPILDTTLAFFRRLLLGRSPFSADKDHLHHRLMLRFGMGHRRSVLTLYGVATAFLFLAIGTAFASRRQTAALVVLSLAFAAFFAWRLGYIGAGFRFVRVRRRNAHLQQQLKGVRAAVREASDLHELWSALEPVCQLVHATRMEFHVGRDGAQTVWHRAGIPGDAPAVVVQVPLRIRSAVTGKLLVVWRDGRSDVDRDEELAIESVAAAAELTLARCEGELHEVIPLPAAEALEPAKAPRRRAHG